MTQNYIERYWRDATPEDAIKEPPMVARFTYYPDGFPGNWEIAIDLLGGFSRDKSGSIVEWFDSSGNRFNNAQVYDAPDAGEGWRLIDVDSETPQHGDEWLDDNGAWKKRSCGGVSSFCNCDIYRRRITPAVTYVPFTWEDREQLRGRWIKESDNVEIQVTAFHCDSKGVFYSEGRSAKVLVERWRFLDTGKPVGKEVTQ